MIFIFGISGLIEVMDLEKCGNTTVNIGAVANLGDSVLSGYGARGSISWPFFNLMNFIEDRGSTAITGGDNDMTSLFKMVHHFNSDALGASYKSHFLHVCSGKWLCFWPFNSYRESDGLNMAATGAFASDLMSQAEELVRRFHLLYNTDPHLIKKWKLVVLWIGLNDQCRYCDRTQSEIDNFEKYVTKTLNYLRLKLEYVIVDIISLWNIDKLVDLSSQHPSCQSSLRQVFFKKHCTCAFGKKAINYRKGMRDFQKQQNRVLQSISKSYKDGSQWINQTMYTATHSTFKVLYDPSSENMDLQEYNWSIVTPTDCSHPTKETHERLASVFWRNLFLKSKDKLTSQNWAFERPYMRFTCPSAIQFD